MKPWVGQSITVFIGEKGTFRATGMPDQAQARMAQQNSFSRQHAGNSIGTLNASGFAGYIGNSNRIVVQPLRDHLVIGTYFQPAICIGVFHLTGSTQCTNGSLQFR